MSIAANIADALQLIYSGCDKASSIYTHHLRITLFQWLSLNLDLDITDVCFAKSS